MSLREEVDALRAKRKQEVAEANAPKTQTMRDKEEAKRIIDKIPGILKEQARYDNTYAVVAGSVSEGVERFVREWATSEGFSVKLSPSDMDGSRELWVCF